MNTASHLPRPEYPAQPDTQPAMRAVREAEQIAMGAARRAARQSGRYAFVAASRAR